MAIVGALARIDPDHVPDVIRRLETLVGVTTFDVEVPAKIGLLIESSGVDEAHGVLTGPVRQTEGVWGVWPVFVHYENDRAAARQVVSESV